MYSSNVTQLVEILSNIDIYLLIFVRVLGFIMLLPVIGARSVPVVTRIGFSLAISVIIYSSGVIETVIYTDSVLGFTTLIIREFLVGLIIGFVVFFITNILYLSGFYIDQQIGLSMVNILDPLSQMQVPIVGNLYYFVICIMLILSGGHYKIIHSFVNSYEVLAIGSAQMVGNIDLFNVILNLMTFFFVTGVKIAMPIIGTIFVLDVALGILVKTAPQINVFVVGVPIKLFIGLFAIWFTVPMLPAVYEFLIDRMMSAVLDVIKVMMP